MALNTATSDGNSSLTESNPKSRITSYNVCYTKLLRSNAGIRELFLGVVSVDDIKSFKPNPAVYSHFLRKSGSTGGESWLISSNPFDVIGAISAGMKSAWVRRSPEAIFDPWGIEPTITVSSLIELDGKIAQS